jgi:hypothetical protein
VKLRDSRIAQAVYAVELSSGALDLGSVGDPGGNRLYEIKDTALYVHANGSVTAFAVGNQWVSLAQGADWLGVYSPPGSITGPYGMNSATPRNFLLTGAGQKVNY